MIYGLYSSVEMISAEIVNTETQREGDSRQKNTEAMWKDTGRNSSWLPLSLLFPAGQPQGEPDG